MPERGLPLPVSQIDANSIPLLPRLNATSHLLSFPSRHTLGRAGPRNPLREVPLAETTPKRRLRVTYRMEGYLSPAAHRLMALLQARGERLFNAARGDE